MINNNLKFLIISHVVHKKISDGIFAAYGPYVKEMNLWFKYVDTVTIVAPISNSTADKIDIEYSKKINLVEVAEINLTNKKTLIKSLIYLPSIFYKTIKAMAKADHIHLRCPGNMGLVGCVAQILYPKTKKTTKFAGNWDKNSKQPWSYQLQKWILNNTYLTKNMQVMVYGKWEDSSKNIVPFFTASYTEALKIPIPDKTFSANAPIRLIFVGALSEGKRPLLSIQIAENLIKKGIKIQLDIFGNGILYNELYSYINNNNLSTCISLHGNQSSDEVIKYYQKAHFLIFISKSEGWPKVVAEAMWWGCLPITTSVSCVPEMLGDETRGSLIEPKLEVAVNTIISYIDNPQSYQQKAVAAKEWSRQFTIEKFESEIAKLIVDNGS